MSNPNTFVLLCVRSIGACVAVIAALLAIAGAAEAATRQVAPGGSNSGDCTSKPCASLSYAYGRAASGDLISVAAGSYGAQEVPNGTKRVTIRGTAGTKFSELDNSASNVTLDHLNVDAGFSQTTGFENHGADNVTVKNASIGNITDEKGALISGSHFTFDNVFIHDVHLTASTVHNECVYAIGVPYMTIRNSRFKTCATMDVFFTYGSWWSPLPPAYGNVTLENNVFGHSTDVGASTWHYYSVAVAATGPDGGTLNGWTVRHNTFEIPANIERDRAPGTVWVGNLGDWNCVSGASYARNVGHKCSGSDIRVSPAKSARNSTAAFGWVSPASFDFHLKAGSPAINTGIASDAPSTDRDGLQRDNRPDAGAYEYGARARGGGNGGGSGSARLRILSARLKPKTICKRPHKGCPKATKLRVSVSMGSRISVQLKKQRKGHKPKRAKAFTFVLERTRTHSIRSRKLRPGRYVVVLVAKRPGLRSEARRLKLRVR